VNHAGEGAPAHEKCRIRPLLREVDEPLHQFFVKVLAGGVAGPAVHGHVGHFKLVPQGKAAEHREAPEERSEVPLDNLLGALALELLGPLFARFHGHRLRPRDVGGVTGNVRIATPDTPLRDTNAIVFAEEFWVVANFKESQIAAMQVGNAVTISLDGILGTAFRGRVESLSPASGAQFALLPPDNATGNFTRIVQRILVKITFDPGQPGFDQLRPGMSAAVTLNGRNVVDTRFQP
jgi:hypothetical protein